MPTAQYPIVTEAEFEDGLRCPGCSREILPGQPYQTILEGVIPSRGGRAAYLTFITCVYCTTDKETSP
jgi:hypothetical protein